MGFVKALVRSKYNIKKKQNKWMNCKKREKFVFVNIDRK